MRMTDKHRLARRCRVSGRVQGVWFRASTRDRAHALGVEGQARNLSDGSVEVLMVGSGEALDRLCQWLHHGPQRARVDTLQCEDIPVPAVSGFSIG